MPTGKNWFFFIFIQFVFILQIMAIYYFVSMKNIRDNWPLYRCNPMYMPFSNDIQKDFVYCVQNMQSNFMGYLLQPLTYVTTLLSSLGGDFMIAINDVREMINKIRNFIGNIVQSVFGVFLNIIIQFQKITIGIKDMISKVIGVMVTMMYVMDGSTKTMQSVWNGPPGQMVKALGHCFHPDTKLRLLNGEVVKMSQVNLGDILENGSKIVAKMDILNDETEKIYRIEKKGVDNEDIYVTGSHLILDEKDGVYKEVQTYCNAILDHVNKTNTFSCLITDDHKIQIGECIFWDWEDYLIKLSYVL
jgi:hypothetical protein